MGAITTHTEMIAGLEAGVRSDQFSFYVGNAGLANGLFMTTYARFTPAAVIPTLPVAVNSTTPGAMIYVPPTSTKQLWLCESEFSANGPALNMRSVAVVYDRLSHSGGLVGNIGTEQTTNLPSAALTRYTSGEGVIPFLEIYSSFGTIGTTCTIRYTNQDGVADRVSKPMNLASNVTASVDCQTPFMLQSGDTGCRSVEGFTIATPTSGAAGNAGITLMKKIATLPSDTGCFVERQAYRQHLFGGGIAEIMPGAFLQLSWSVGQGGTGLYTILGRLGIIEK